MYSKKNLYVVTGHVTFCMYMEYLAIIRNDTFKNHIDILDDVLNKLENQEFRLMQFNAIGPKTKLSI